LPNFMRDSSYPRRITGGLRACQATLGALVVTA
jgi:hypothetical protein